LISQLSPRPASVQRIWWGGRCWQLLGLEGPSVSEFGTMRYFRTTVYLCAIVNVSIAGLFFFPLLLLLIPLAVAAVHAFVRDFRDM
jgi:hypothetical protein